MIEKIVRDFLEEKLKLGVYLEVPKGETTFIVLEKTGSYEENYIYNTTIAIQSYGASLYEAAQLNSQVIEVMKEIIELDEISSCELNSDYNFTDTETKRYRYQAVYDLTHY